MKSFSPIPPSQVFDCSDMTECVPNFLFAPNHTFTAPMAARAADAAYGSMFSGKWHLGSLYNDSEKYGGVTSSPVTHGFGDFNATVEVAPTATTNCNCNKDWESQCMYGHDKQATHCNGVTGPGGNNCCFNYWWPDNDAPHAVTNLTQPTPPDDTEYLSDAFERFLVARAGEPFMAQISFHNCHIPFIGTDFWRKECAAGRSCKPGNYSDAQLDFYACLIELDAAVGRVLSSLDTHNYRDNTMLWFTTDNGPEGNCQPEGRCTPEHLQTWPGSAGPLRGRKRDIWEGGHRVPGLVSWPAVVKGNHETWETVVTMDFLPTIMEVLGVQRPVEQQHWAMDGQSIMPLLTGKGVFPARGLGWMYKDTKQVGFRYGKWKLVHGTASCSQNDCEEPLLYNLELDVAEARNVAQQNPEILHAITANFTVWLASVMHSREVEQGCPKLSLDPYPETL